MPARAIQDGHMSGEKCTRCEGLDDAINLPVQHHKPTAHLVLDQLTTSPPFLTGFDPTSSTVLPDGIRPASLASYIFGQRS